MHFPADQIEAITKQLPSEEDFHPGVSIDCVIFGYHEKELKVLCTKSGELEQWYLPSGYIKKTESVEQAAYRISQERTGIKELFLRQFHTFGDENRSLVDSQIGRQLNSLPKPILDRIKWQLTKRFVSICYYALVEFTKVVPQIDIISTHWMWADVQTLPPMILDHSQIIARALKTMRRDLQYEPIGPTLLPEKFTITEMQALYETILGRKLDQRNFAKKLLALAVIRKTNEKKNIGRHRAPALYKFNKRAYNKAMKQEYDLIF